jgi:electron transfer flavoprotein beta subunit
VETALRLNENAKGTDKLGETIVVTLGPKDTAQTLRQALAMGADRGILVEADDNKLDSLVVARALKAIVEKEKPDVVLLGKQAVDGDSNATAQILAELLGWPQATFAMSNQDQRRRQEHHRRPRGRHRRAHRQGADPRRDQRRPAHRRPQGGAERRDPDSHEYAEGARYASLKGIMQAKKKPIAEQALASLGIDATPGTSYIK